MRERSLPCALCKTSSATHLTLTHARTHAQCYQRALLLSQAQPAMIITTSIRENIFTRDKSSKRERANRTRGVGAAAVREMKLTPRRRHLLQCSTGPSSKAPKNPTNIGIKYRTHILHGVARQAATRPI